MANNLMSGTLSSIIKEQLDNAVSKGDTALETAMQQKKFEDCVQALFQAFRKLATSNCAMSGSDELIGSAAIHWYTESEPTVESIVGILKTGTEVLKMEAPKANGNANPNANPNKGKASVPTAKPKVNANPNANPNANAKKGKAVIPTAKPTPPKVEVVDDDDFDID